MLNIQFFTLKMNISKVPSEYHINTPTPMNA